MSGKEEERENRRRASLVPDHNGRESAVERERLMVDGKDDDREQRAREQRRNVIASDSPVIKKELREIIDNFGKAQSEPAFKQTAARTEISETSLFYQHLTYSESQREADPDTNVLEEYLGKESSEDTTLDGKIIEICEDSHVCHEDCHCRGYLHSLSEVEPIPSQYYEQNPRRDTEPDRNNLNRGEMFYNVSSTSPPLNVEKVKKYMEKVKDNRLPSFKEKKSPGCVCTHKKSKDARFAETSACLSCSQEEADRGYTNRFCSKTYLAEDCLLENGSGETIPQLYKAKLRQLSGAVPERFTFKAYTGSPLCRGPKETVDVHRLRAQGPQYQPLDSNKKSKEVVLKKPDKTPNVFSFDDKHFPAPRACLNFEGNEYISTRGLPERIDIYCFDHLNTSYFRTSDQPPPLITDVAMERTEAFATRFWAELFGFIHIVIAFIIAFILQLYKFMLYSIVRPIMIGLVQLTSDYLLKPFLTIIYNGFTQPLLVFLFNIAASLRDVCSPIARAIGYFFTEIAVVLRAIRIIDVNKAPLQPAMKDSSC